MSNSRKKIVIDTNVLVSALLNSNSNEGKVYYHIIENEKVVLSQDLFNEYTRTISKTKFKKYFDIEEISEALALLLEVGKIIKTKSKIFDCRDAKDNKLLELAVDSKANYIISGDDDLLSLNPYKKIKIITARQFMEKFL